MIANDHLYFTEDIFNVIKRILLLFFVIFGLYDNTYQLPITESDLVFTDLSGLIFWFGSGAGAWRTTLEIMPDGTFYGHFSDTNTGESGHNYLGTTYECYFNGKFSILRKIGDYTYIMKCESLTQDGTIGDEIIFAGHKKIISTPYGFDDADEFILYLPGTQKRELPEGFLSWSHGLFLDDLLDTYGLYNISGETGFIVWPEWDSWQPQTTSITWKGITYGQSFFDLYININGIDYYAGNFFGENLWQYKRTDAPEYVLACFRGIWTGSGSEFYLKRKNETEVAVMYHDIPYKNDPFDFAWDDYEEILVMPIGKNKKIEIGEPIIINL